ncbi:MAG: glycosyltransferase [Acidimicrobiia bacterium]
MEIHQLLVAATPGDAVTGAALEIQRLLSRVGPSDMYACHRDVELDGAVRPLESYRDRLSAGTGRNLLVVHASIGDPRFSNFLRSRPEKIVLVYHNITPARFFSAHDTNFALLLASGRAELELLRERTVLAIADSEFNAAELRAIGYESVRVVPVPVDPLALRDEPEVPSLTLNHLDTVFGRPFLLSVGQLLPHKRPDLLIEAFHLLVTEMRPDARLVMVGPARIGNYAQAVRRLVQELNLANVWLTGTVERSDLAAFYRRATAFVTASEHEGFCIPLLEAMAFDLPIVARSFAAMGETLGDAGLLLPAASGPALLAEAMAAVLDDADLRADLASRGRARLAAFDPDVGRGAFLDALLQVA